MDFLKNLFTKNPGLLRTVTVAYVLAVVVLKALHLDQIADTIGSVAGWIGLTPANVGFPVDQAALTAALLSAIALIRAVVRWVLNKNAS